MKRIDVFQIPFYQFQCDDELSLKIYEDVCKLDYIPEDDVTNGHIYNSYYSKELFDWFNNCIAQVSKIYFKENLTFPIVDCWVNKYQALNKLKKHFHPNAAICGCYYVTTHDSGDTIFEYPDPWLYQNNFLSINKNMIPLEAKIKPTSGTLILFPPNLYHYMKPYKNVTKTRYTIAFNTFPSGVISDRSTTKLELKIISVEEKSNLSKL